MAVLSPGPNAAMSIQNRLILGNEKTTSISQHLLLQQQHFHGIAMLNILDDIVISEGKFGHLISSVIIIQNYLKCLVKKYVYRNLGLECSW